MNEMRIVGNDIILSVDEVTATIENAALIEDNRRLQADNAKLRELLREILNNCCEGIESTCDMCGCYRKSDGACMADVMAIELGVDV